MSKLKDSHWSDSFLMLQSLVSYAMRLEHTRRYDEAKALFLRILEWFRNTLGETHHVYAWASACYREMLEHIEARKGKSKELQCQPADGAGEVGEAEAKHKEQEVLSTNEEFKTTFAASPGYKFTSQSKGLEGEDTTAHGSIKIT